MIFTTPRRILTAIKAFQDGFDLPDTLPDVKEDSVVLFPHNIVIRGKIVPISYDKENNIITYRGQ